MPEGGFYTLIIYNSNAVNLYIHLSFSIYHEF
jgi:hypothetical protein